MLMLVEEVTAQSNRYFFTPAKEDVFSNFDCFFNIVVTFLCQLNELKLKFKRQARNFNPKHACM